MKTDDIFEALTDIDDKFIAAARPGELGDDQSAVFRPAPRKPLWKTLVPAAACVAVLGVAGAFGARYIKEGLRAETSANTAASGDSLSSSQGGVVINITPTPEALPLTRITSPKKDGKTEFPMEEFKDRVFTFTRDRIYMNGVDMDEETLIQADGLGSIQELYLFDINGDGVRELCAWARNADNTAAYLDFVDLVSGDRYASIQETYNIIEEEGAPLALLSGTLHHSSAYLKADYQAGVYTLMMSEARKGVKEYDPLSADRLIHIYADPSAPRHIGDDKYFGAEEFPDEYFINQDGHIISSNFNGDALKCEILSGYEFFFADLNGDGYRELCAFANDNDPLITVYDIRNGDTYVLAANDTFKGVAWLDTEGGECGVYAVTREHEPGTTDNLVPITLDMLEKTAKPDYTEVPLYFDQTFLLSYYEGFTFAVYTDAQYPSINFNWADASRGTGNDAERVFLCDLDGDGVREIVMQCWFADGCCIRVYGFMEDGEIGETLYYENGGYKLVESDGKLFYETKDGEIKPLVSLKSDRKAVFTQYYTEIISWNHSMDYSQILPWSVRYNYSIEDRRLIIKEGKGLKRTIDTTDELTELYRICDQENNRLIFAYTTTDGDIYATRITEGEIIEMITYHLQDGLSLKPMPDDLMIVDGYGNEYTFKDSYESLMR